MARGMVVGEQIQSQAATPEYRENHERIFGERKAVRGRWIWSDKEQRLVSAEEYVPEKRAIDGTIMCDRFMEGHVATDGTDIGSRQKRKAFMQANDLVDYDDCKGLREAKAKEREARARGEFKPDKQLRETLGRELYKHKVII